MSTEIFTASRKKEVTHSKAVGTFKEARLLKEQNLKNDVKMLKNRKSMQKAIGCGLVIGDKKCYIDHRDDASEHLGYGS